MFPETPTRRPLVDPILLALKSRRVLVALVSLVVGLLIAAVPPLGPVRDELLVLLTALALALIGGYSVEDAARAARNRAEPSQEALYQLIKDVFVELVDELARQYDQPHEPAAPAQAEGDHASA